eukprot:comp17046_c0_seq1/m.15773 comp17046_c0_seq1/g.15773  ORF comp17046_c0_seq1/g.15773 comp17046_c0_seq1/m.15773 type:complete len:492 (-) comp17046_c0_seq1:876-2351(-)
MGRSFLLSLAIVATWGIIPGATRITLKPSSPTRTPATKNANYNASWDSLDTRDNPSWFSEAKFSVGIDWGVFSVPSYCLLTEEREYRCDAERFLYYSSKPEFPEHKFLVDRYGKDFNYTQFTRDFTCDFFDPREWASVLWISGAKLVVMNAKNGDGYCMWGGAPGVDPSWTVQGSGPHKDLLTAVANAVRSLGMNFGIKYSLGEWFNTQLHGTDPPSYVKTVVQPQLRQLVDSVGPEFIFADTETGYDSGFWGSKEFLAWLFSESRVKDKVVVNDRWGEDATGYHGGVYTCEYAEEGSTCIWEDPTHPWMVYEGLGVSIGYNRLDVYNTPNHFIQLLVQTVAGGGHLHLSVGPMSDGRLPQEQKDILRELGVWLRTNGEAIYGTTPFPFTGLTVACLDPGVAANVGVCFTRSNTTVYAITLGWPGPKIILGPLAGPNNNTAASLVGSTAQVPVSLSSDGVATLHVPKLTIDQLPCMHAWAFKITGLNLDYI